MISLDYLLLIAGMGLVTFLPRWAPLFFLSQRKLPVWFVEWLDLIPAAILSALLVPALVTASRDIWFCKPKCGWPYRRFCLLLKRGRWEER